MYDDYYDELEVDELNEYSKEEQNTEKQTRKYIITQNNPQNYGLATPEDIEKVLNQVVLKYACFCFEKAPTTGTLHVHIYIDFGTPRGFKTPQNLFPHADIRAARGTAIQIRDYITKTGKHATSPSAALNLRDTFTEMGSFDMKQERKAKRDEIVLRDLNEGKSVEEIVNDHPELIYKEKMLEAKAEKIRYDKIPDYRQVEVIYICGDTGVGKTRLIHEENVATDICSITTYPRYGEVRFDAYSAHKVLVFEEFRSQIQISHMLSYLDGYKIMLPARYSDKVSAYEKVYMTSNWDLGQQYYDVQRMNIATWRQTHIIC